MKKLKEKFKVFKAIVAYAYAKFKAAQLNRVTHRRQFIVMTDNGRLLVMDKDVFYKLRKRKVMPRYVKPHMLNKISVWYSAARCNGKPCAAMPQRQADDKRRRYLQYVRSLKLKK